MVKIIGSCCSRSLVKVLCKDMSNIVYIRKRIPTFGNIKTREVHISTACKEIEPIRTFTTIDELYNVYDLNFDKNDIIFIDILNNINSLYTKIDSNIYSTSYFYDKQAKKYTFDQNLDKNFVRLSKYSKEQNSTLNFSKITEDILLHGLNNISVLLRNVKHIFFVKVNYDFENYFFKNTSMRNVLKFKSNNEYKLYFNFIQNYTIDFLKKNFKNVSIIEEKDTSYYQYSDTSLDDNGIFHFKLELFKKLAADNYQLFTEKFSGIEELHTLEFIKNCNKYDLIEN